MSFMKEITVRQAMEYYVEHCDSIEDERIRDAARALRDVNLLEDFKDADFMDMLWLDALDDIDGYEKLLEKAVAKQDSWWRGE